jgi:hypothetical protein
MMMKKVYKRAAFIIIPMAVASAFIEPVKLPLGIIIGALLAVVNFRGMTRNLEGLIGTDRPTMKLMVLSIGRLLIIFSAIIALAVARVVDLLGLMVGFTVVLILVIREGYLTSQAEPPEEQP